MTCNTMHHSQECRHCIFPEYMCRPELMSSCMHAGDWTSIKPPVQVVWEDEKTCSCDQSNAVRLVSILCHFSADNAYSLIILRLTLALELGTLRLAPNSLMMIPDLRRALPPPPGALGRSGPEVPATLLPSDLAPKQVKAMVC